MSVEFIETKEQLKESLQNKYAWPGGYPKFYILKDYQPICHDCLKQIIDEFSDEITWQDVTHAEINWENEELYCDFCSDRIECAYPSDEEETKE